MKIRGTFILSDQKRVLALLGQVALLTLNFQSSTLAQGTAFTYQGRLSASGSPANGVYDFTFQAFDALTGGSSVGGTVNVNGVGVTNGLFTALVDLGATPFTGPARWLQISVSTNGAGSFTILTPRQPLTPSPYAIYANTAGTVTNAAIANAQLAANAVAAGNIQNSAITAGKVASGQVVKSLNGLTDAVSLTQGANVTINTVGNSLQISAPAGGLNLPFSGSASSTGSVFTISNTGAGAAGVFLGKVGIGTGSPATLLDMRAISASDGIHISRPGKTNEVYLSIADADYGHFDLGGETVIRGGTGSGVGSSFGGDVAVPKGNVGIGTTTPAAKLHVSGGHAAFGGNVGIGTTTPQARLEVRGDIRLGSSGQFRATSGEENLRIIRGSIDWNGTLLLRGSGFTVVRLERAKYQINFNTPFADIPSVTATTDRLAESPTMGIYKDGISKSSVILVTYRIATGDFVDWSFDFIAVGPR